MSPLDAGLAPHSVYMERTSSTQYRYDTLVIDDKPYGLNQTWNFNDTTWPDMVGIHLLTRYRRAAERTRCFLRRHGRRQRQHHTAFGNAAMWRAALQDYDIALLQLDGFRPF